MSRNPRLWIVIGTAGLLLAGIAAYRWRSSDTGSNATIHAVAPEFSLTTIDGKTLALSDYRGKIILLDFWATWCTPCRDEIPRFVRLQDKYGAAGFQIIGISMDDSAEPVRQFHRDFHINYPIALGGARLGELYGGVFGLPIAFLIDRQGRILSKHVGATDPVIFDQEIASALDAKTRAQR